MLATGSARRTLSSPLRRFLTGLLFVSPWLVGLCSFTVYPILASLYYSLTEYDVINPPRFVGLANYVDLLTSDDNFFTVLYNTLYFVVFDVPPGIPVTFLLATLLNTGAAAPALPHRLLPARDRAGGRIAMVWLWIYNPSYGLVTSQLASFGMTAIPWLSSPGLAKVSLIIVHVWAQGTAMLIFLAGLQDVPRTSTRPPTSTAPTRCSASATSRSRCARRRSSS